MKVKLTNTWLSKSQSAAKNKTGAILRINTKNVDDEELPYELFLTTRQTTKTRNAFANNISTDIKLTKTQISKIIQWGGSFDSWFGNFGKKELTNFAIPLARDSVTELASDLASNAISKFERKIIVKGFILFISNEVMDNIIKTIKSLKDWSVLTDGVTETVKHETRKQEGESLKLLAASIVQPVISLVLKDVCGREVRRTGRGYLNKNL